MVCCLAVQLMGLDSLLMTCMPLHWNDQPAFPALQQFMCSSTCNSCVALCPVASNKVVLMLELLGVVRSHRREGSQQGAQKSVSPASLAPHHVLVCPAMDALVTAQL